MLFLFVGNIPLPRVCGIKYKLNCVSAYEDGWLPTRESVPRLKNEVLVAKVKEPCGAGCFLNHPGPYNEVGIGCYREED